MLSQVNKNDDSIESDLYQVISGFWFIATVLSFRNRVMEYVQELTTLLPQFPNIAGVTTLLPVCLSFPVVDVTTGGRPLLFLSPRSMFLKSQIYTKT